MARKERILVVDDDVSMVKLLKINLEARGYEVVVAQNGNEAIKKSENEALDMIILDIMMPGVDGFDVCQLVRKWSDMPIIILTAMSKTENKVYCLELGADDYITKPFAIDELLARVRATLRRNKTGVAKLNQPNITVGNLYIDFTKRAVSIAGNEVKLTPTEYSLLQELVVNGDKVLTGIYLLNAVWGNEYQKEKEYLRVYINRLRTKLKECNIDRERIITVSGVGYQFKL